jgi:dCMP deaminase
MNRPTIDVSLMAVAEVWAERSTCSRNHVGVVIARNGRTIGSGYNGAPAGMAHCEHTELRYEKIYGPGDSAPRRATPPYLPKVIPESTGLDRGCRVAIHAEANALAYAARHGVSVEGATVYTTLSPCYACSQLIIAAGLSRVVFNRSYRDPAGIDLLRLAGLTVEKV